jgi:hypothetical protein
LPAIRPKAWRRPIRRVVNTGSALDCVEKKVIVELLSRLNQSVQGYDVPLRGYHFVG